MVDKMEIANMGFGTKAIHSGNMGDTKHGALAMPIYQTSTFVFETCEQGGRRFAKEEDGFIYGRGGNPTTMHLEQKLAVLENGEAAIATGSGMGAISATLWTICKAGAHVVVDSTLYGCTYSLMAHGLPRYGVETTLLDTSDCEAVRAALKENTAAVYLETPANPNMKIADIRAIAKMVHDYNPAIKVICDNTFASPYLQRPLELGADVVVHSATKYLNGHGDVLAGAIIGKEDFIKEVRGFGIKDMTGSVLSPNDAFLILRGLKTLEVRMERHCANAKQVVDYLVKHPKITTVYYPGLPSHPLHEVAKAQMDDFGGMLSFEVQGGKAAGTKLLNSLKICALAVSLGDAETLVEHPATMTHATYTAEELAAVGIPEGLVRMSAGLENAKDIIADLEQALAQV